MGITGLLPFLNASSKRTNIKEFAGGTVAIDSYCWLHKGVFPCADKLTMGQPTDAYVRYCMKFIDMLLHYKIKPILVFDGRHLPAKAQTESKRREARQANRRKAIELMKMGQQEEARNLLRRSIDVTHEMALELIKQCQKMNIDCIVAPYEADAQLAYLNIKGIADVVITEDSDLTLFGCKKVFFKMDVNGNGILVDQELLHLAMGLRSEHFSMDNFRYMCILSGCDYLPSLPGIGLNKAKKFIMINKDCDIHRALTRLGSYLNMKSLVVTKEYRDSFILAEITFKHQLVFCPLQRKQVRLNPPMPEVTEEQLYYAGAETNPDIALQLAFGNCDPFTLEVLHNFNPDKIQSQENQCNTWRQKPNRPKHISIWAKEYKLNTTQGPSQNKDLMVWPNTAGKEMVLNTNRLKTTVAAKQEDNSDYEELNQKGILDIYESKGIMNVENNSNTDISNQSNEIVSPILIRRSNPFSKQLSNNKTSPSLLSTSKMRRGRNLMRVRRTIVNEDVITESKFFSKPIDESSNNIVTDNDMLCSPTNSNEMLLEEENMRVEKTDKSIVNNLQTQMVNDKMEVESSNNIVIDDDMLCSPTNSNEMLLEKENMRVENTDKSNVNNLQTLMVNDELEAELHSTDVDKFSSNECQNTASNCDLGKSYFNVQIDETISNKSSSESYNSTTSLTSSEYDVDPDFIIQQDARALNRSLFWWPDTKLPTQLSSKTKQTKSESSSNSRTPARSKINMANSTRRSQQLYSAQRQQSLLSMFGFEKKKLV